MEKAFVLTDLEVEEVSLVHEPANPDAKVVIYKAASAAQPTEKVMAEEKKTDAAAAETKTEDVAKAAEAMVKSLREELEAQKATAAAAVSKASEAADEFRKKFDAEVRTRKTKESIDKANTVFKSIPGKADELGALLLELSEKAPESAVKVEALLTKCNEAISKSAVFAQVSATQIPAGSVEAEFDDLIAKAVAANPKLNVYSATREVMKSNPEIYERYIAEKAKKN